MSGWTIRQRIGDNAATPKEPEDGAFSKFRAKANHIYKGESFTLFETVQKVVEDFLSTPLTNRLNKLSNMLEGKDPDLARRVRSIKTEFDKNDWGEASTDDGSARMPAVAYFTDVHIEGNLPNVIIRMLYQIMVESLVGADCTAWKYQEHMRHAAGLNAELSADTEDFLMLLHRRLYADYRKEWMDIKPGGSESPLRKYSHALCAHYERLRPIWKQAKKIYKQHGGGINGRDAVKRVYRDFSPFIEGTLGAQNPDPKHIGLPEKLIAKLETAREDVKEDDSSPARLAYQHAAFLCGFKIDVYSAKQLKRVMSDHKKMMGTEYYNQTFKSEWAFSGTVNSG